jgi:hypothetical protein
MSRIIYLCPFPDNVITGGVKTAYRHVELLVGMGYDAWVWQPQGHPFWFKSQARRLDGFSEHSISPDDVLVFPEVIAFPEFAPFLHSSRPCVKLLFCQNQYYVFNDMIPKSTYAQLGFRDVFCSCGPIKRMLESVLGLKDVALIPYDIDRDRFRPRPKTLQIAAIPRKMPRHASMIAFMFKAKYPDTRHVPFVVIENFTEDQLAETLGTSEILLSLSHFEGLGLIPIEAMASGCLVAGYHGHGGLEYARPENGFWFGADEHEAVADALHKLIKGVENGEEWIQEMRDAGQRVADAYNLSATHQALATYYGGLGLHPGQ